MSHLTPVPSDPEQLRAFLDQQRIDEFEAAMHNPTVTLPPAPEEVRALTVKVTLDDTNPPVWRRLLVPGDTTLDRLHDVLQAAMGWTDSHLHRFYAGPDRRAAYFPTDYDIEEGDEGTLEKEVRLDQLLGEVGDRFRYEYDFGDGWEHEIRLEQLDPLTDDPRPRCLAGHRACPPEDVGGARGYDEVAAWVRAGQPTDAVPDRFDSAEHAAAWLPDGWDPDEFGVADTDLRLQALATTDDLLAALRPELVAALSRLPGYAMPAISQWLASASARSLSPSDIDDLTQPHRTLLAAIGGGVPLSAAGYLPGPLVQKLCPALGIDPILAGKGNREHNVRPLATFRKAVQAAGLLHTQHKMVMPTVKGIQYGDDPAALWQHLASRLPVGRGELNQDVGWFTLLALAGGVDENDLHDEVHQLCRAAGWANGDGAPIEYWDVVPFVWPHLIALIGPRYNSLRSWPSWVPAAAAAVIFTEQPTR